MKIVDLGEQPYLSVYEAMKQFTETRDEKTEDQLWVVTHPPVYTQGQNGKPEHILNPGNIPVVQVDRGGQVTYHGPGQIVIYTLINFRARQCGVRALVRALEQAIIATLAEYGVEGYGDVNAPGVYVSGKKIAALGLRIRKGSVYHGLSLNVDMDLTPFSGINPCGYQGLEVTQLVDWLETSIDIEQVKEKLLSYLTHYLAVEQLLTTNNRVL